jgi:hypothetical protein
MNSTGSIPSTNRVRCEHAQFLPHFAPITSVLSRRTRRLKALVERAERLLWLAKMIATKAQKDDDARLALQAVDRARASLEQLIKVHGPLPPDGIDRGDRER